MPFVLLYALAPASPAAWIEKEYSTPGSPPLAEVEAFLNTECRPSGLDGIQTLAVQRGHEDLMHLHVYCRRDGARKARYRVTMRTAPKGKALGLAKEVMADPRTKIGPFHFGENNGDDGILLIEKVG